MVAYEFYIRENSHGDRLIGILPERRRKPERINDESIMRWATTVFSTTLDTKKIFFIRVTIEKNGDGFYFPIPQR